MFQQSKLLRVLVILLALLTLLGTIPYAQAENSNSPRALKYQAIDILQVHISPGYVSPDDPIGEALQHIRKSLEDELWETDWTLTDKGKAVFDEERAAVEILMKLREAADANPVIKDSALAAIRYLAAADRALTSTAINQAIAMAQAAGCYTTDSYRSKCQKLLHTIALAQKEIAIADEEVANGRYEKATDYYKRAWQLAQFEEHHFYGFVQTMPDSYSGNTFVGPWVIASNSGLTATFVADASTEFIENHGPLQVGAYVQVTYFVLGGVNYATRIESIKYYVASQVIARLKPEADVAAIRSDYNATALGHLLGRIYLLGLQLGTNEWETVDTMRNDWRFEYAEPNVVSRTPEGNPYDMWAWGGYDPTPAQTQYANEHLDLPLARELSTGSGVVVAVLDTGVQLDHPALASHLVAGYDFVDGDTVPADEGNGLDDDGDELIDEAVGHGTHVAGIVLLVAPESQIMPLRVLNGDGMGNVFDVAQAIVYATDHGAQVLNLSLGIGFPSGALLDAVNHALSAGVMVVAAAGNLDSTEPQYPAADEGVIAVAALDEQQLKTSFSNYGSWVDLAAPGESIYSALPIDGYGWWSGTSMATPFVSGQIALLHSLAPWLTLSQIEGQMMTKVRNLDELNPDYAGQLGAGEPDVAASLGCHWADVEPDATHDILNNQCDDDVDIADVQSVAAQWGLPQPPGSAYDTDHDGDVDVADIQRVANRWGWKR